MRNEEQEILKILGILILTGILLAIFFSF